MNDSMLAVTYSLARHIPDMARGFTIQTHYGDLVVAADEAPAFIRLTEKALKRRLAQLERAETLRQQSATAPGA